MPNQSVWLQAAFFLESCSPNAYPMYYFQKIRLLSINIVNLRPQPSTCYNEGLFYKNMETNNTTLKAGILGGGQLGRMLLQQAANYTVETYVLENDRHCPAAHLCHHFILGNIQ